MEARSKPVRWTYAEFARLPSVDVLFAEGDYLEPDIVFVAADHRGCLTGVRPGA